MSGGRERGERESDGERGRVFEGEKMSGREKEGVRGEERVMEREGVKGREWEGKRMREGGKKEEGGVGRREREVENEKELRGVSERVQGERGEV